MRAFTPPPKLSQTLLITINPMCDRSEHSTSYNTTTVEACHAIRTSKRVNEGDDPALTRRGARTSRQTLLPRHPAVIPLGGCHLVARRHLHAWGNHCLFIFVPKTTNLRARSLGGGGGCVRVVLPGKGLGGGGRRRERESCRRGTAKPGAYGRLYPRSSTGAGGDTVRGSAPASASPLLSLTRKNHFARKFGYKK